MPPIAAKADPGVLEIDAFGLEQFTAVASAFGHDRYGYVVTPNVDHLIRWHDDASFRDHYAAASFVLMDSRVASRMLRLLRGLRLPVCTGSDLTALLFRDVIGPQDRVVLIGGSADQARAIASRYGLRDLRHHEPPMGFIHDPRAVELCLGFIEDCGPFRFCFIAVGSPQQEAIAHALAQRGVARGLALCVGASLNFIVGTERRAPVWMQRAGLEWLYRLCASPGRLARRYLLRGPRFLPMALRCRISVRSR